MVWLGKKQIEIRGKSINNNPTSMERVELLCMIEES